MTNRKNASQHLSTTTAGPLTSNLTDASLCATGAKNRVKRLIGLLASLRLTVILLAMGIFIVFAGTVAQIDKGIWTVTDQYFRTGLAWIELRIFFPRQWDIPGGFYFPGGWLIASVLLVNLLAAHLMRLKIRALGSRLIFGLILILLGSISTSLVIGQGVEPNQIDAGFSPSWRIGRQLLQGSGAAVLLLLGCLLLFQNRAGIVLLHSGVVLIIASELITGAMAVEATMTIAEGETVDFVDHSLDYELAVIDKSAPDHDQIVVVPHSILHKAASTGHKIQHKLLPFDLQVLRFMTNSDLQISTDELQQQIDLLDQHVVQLQSESEQITNDQLNTLDGHRHMLQKQLELVRRQIDVSPITSGAGLRWLIKEKPQGAGVGQMDKDAPGAVIRFLDKSSQQSLGTYLVSLWFYPNFTGRQVNEPQIIEVGEQLYTLHFRNRRERLRRDTDQEPISINLVDFKHDVYIGTDVPKNYSSDIVLNDPERNVVNREARIWMNNPLRYGGRIFYQASFLKSDGGTVLQVVKNAGWMVPYVACMIVATGMLAQFSLSLKAFLRKRWSA